MGKHILKAGLTVAVLLMLMTSGAVLLNAQTAATEGMDELCGLNPGLHAAITQTLASHPPMGYEDTETYQSLMYFWATVIKDAEWCATGRLAGIDPDLAERTMRWHYGNASEFMRQYREMVQGALPTATPIPAQVYQRVVESVNMRLTTGDFDEPLGDLWLGVSYENESQWNLDKPEIRIRFVDENATAITDWLYTGYRGFGVTRPGELSYGTFYISEDRIPSEWHSYELQAISSVTTNVPYEHLTTERVIAQPVIGTAWAIISGVVTNTGPITIDYGGVFVVVREPDGRLQSVNWGHFDKERKAVVKDAEDASLGPYESSVFLINISEVPLPGDTFVVKGVAWNGWAGEE